MIADYYYYQQLSDREKTLYKAIYSAVTKYETKVVVKNIHYSKEDIDKVYLAVLNDNPHFFYFDQRRLEYRWDLASVEINLNYLLSEADCRKYAKIVNEKAGKILQYAKLDGKSDYEKVKTIHDILSGRVQYAYEWLDCDRGMEFLYAHSILGVFCPKKSVCEGIAKAYKLLLNAVGVKCIVVSGQLKSDSTSANHAWNIVKIDGKTYHVDSTNDICNSTKEYTNYDYFCLSDEQISFSHSGFDGMPQCDDIKYDFFYCNGADITSERSLDKYIKRKSVQIPCEIYVRIQYAVQKDFIEVVTSVKERAMNLITSRDYGLMFDTTYNESQRTIRIRVRIRV